MWPNPLANCTVPGAAGIARMVVVRWPADRCRAERNGIRFEEFDPKVTGKALRASQTDKAKYSTTTEAQPMLVPKLFEKVRRQGRAGVFEVSRVDLIRQSCRFASSRHEPFFGTGCSVLGARCGDRRPVGASSAFDPRLGAAPNMRGSGESGQGLGMAVTMHGQTPWQR